MQLIFRIHKIEQNQSLVEIILKRKNKIIRAEAEEAEDALDKLDRILKKSKIEITDIKNIRIDNLNKSKYTTYRILKSIEKALRFSIKFINK